jgi:hypothetical protein
MSKLDLDPTQAAAIEGYVDGDTVSVIVTGTLSSLPTGGKSIAVTSVSESEMPEESEIPMEEVEVAETAGPGAPAIGMMMAKRGAAPKV